MARGKRRRRYRISLVAAAVVAACGTTRSPPTAPAPPLSTVAPRAPEARARVQVGMATYYADRFRGRKTASGERYDPRRLTAAHKTLPMGTVVRVVRVDKGGAPMSEPVVVRINDRGPYASGRIIDLSMAAARQLDMIKAGVVRVRVEILRDD